MKFSWKMFFSCVIVITLAFGCGSFILISSLFDSGLEREKEATMQENRFLYVSLFSDINTMAISDKDSLDAAVTKLQNSLSRNNSSESFIGAKQVLHFDGADFAASLESGMRICRIVSHDGFTYVQVISRLRITGSQAIYLENLHNITPLYEQRDQYLNLYRVILLLVVVISSVIIFVLSRLLTSPLKKLSAATCKIVEGDYSMRITRAGNDEIGRLTDDFNKMAVAVEHNINELERAAKRQEDFSASLAHELKTPLTSIIGYADMLRSYELDAADRRMASEYIFSEGKRLEQLSFKLLDLMVYGKADFLLSPISARVFTNETVHTLRPLLSKYCMTLITDIDDTHILIDSTLLKTLIYNLVDNACKASEKGNRILFSIKQTPGGCIVSVKDSGSGIPKEQLDRITEPFYMVDKSRSRKLNGAGLGLSIAQRIAAIHGAALMIESEYGAGTTVSFILKGGDGIC